MALDTLIAGRYAATYNASDVGITTQGYELSMDLEMEDIAETDAFGLSVIDGIWRGGNCFFQFSSKAYKTGSLAAFWPYGGTLAGNGVLGILVDDSIAAPNKLPIGMLASTMARIFILTAAAGTPAAATPATLTATYALLAKNSNKTLLFDSRLREVPVRLRLYPYTGASITRFFSTT